MFRRSAPQICSDGRVDVAADYFKEAHLSRTATKVILVPKLAKIALALLRNGSSCHRQETSQAPTGG